MCKTDLQGFLKPFFVFRCKQLISAGAKEGTSPADVVQQCDITFSCVSDSNAVRDVREQIFVCLNKIFIQSSV